jgi:CO/xanthine dehydrogenase Mo-binding subunit
VQAFLNQIADDAGSPLGGCGLDDVTVAGGRIHRTGQPGRSEVYTDILARDALDQLTADGDSAPPNLQDAGLAPAGPYAARFAEVRVDPDLGLLRVTG